MWSLGEGDSTSDLAPPPPPGLRAIPNQSHHWKHSNIWIGSSMLHKIKLCDDKISEFVLRSLINARGWNVRCQIAPVSKPTNISISGRFPPSSSHPPSIPLPLDPVSDVSGSFSPGRPLQQQHWQGQGRPIIVRSPLVTLSTSLLLCFAFLLFVSFEFFLKLVLLFCQLPC